MSLFSRILRRVLMAVLLLVVIAFIASNLGDVSLSFFPLPFEVDAPLYVVCLFMFVLGYSVRALFALPRHLALKHEIQTKDKRQQALNQEIGSLKAQQRSKAMTASTADNA